MEVVGSLERFGRYDFFTDGSVRIMRWSERRALEEYRQTLFSIPSKLEGEPPSATMMEEVQVEWSTEEADIGKNVRQRHIGRTHPEVRQAVNDWFDSGQPYPSSGGFYYTTPNKSYKRVQDLMTQPELRDAVLNLGIEEDWLRFWDTYIPLRHDMSEQLLQMLKTGSDPEALSRHNEQAGTGLHIRGRRLKRVDLFEAKEELDFLLKYSAAMAIAFAATQIAELPPGQVFVVEVYDARIRGAIASRSDMDVKDARWDGEHLTIEGVAQTRQAGSDGSGALSNSHTERRLLGSSVTEKVLREFKHNRVEYPFSNRDMMLYAWSLDAKPFPGKQYLIGEDFGLSKDSGYSPINSPADALFSRGFIRVGGKMMPMMLSGSGWTQAVYSVFHNHFIEKTDGDDRLMALGDDMNLITATAEYDVFAPYIKVKGTDPAENTKKMLGLYTKFSQNADPEGKEPALIGIVPRAIKTVSSASKRGSYWGEQLSGLPDDGSMMLRPSEETAELIKQDLPVLLPYMHWKGPRHELLPMLAAKWGRIDKITWDILIRYNEELQHRIQPDESDADPE